MATNEDTTRRMPAPDAVARADARLKLVKAVDDVAAALEKLHVAAQKAHPHDLLVVAEECPIPCRALTERATFRDDLAAFTRETMLWAAHLHDPHQFEDLGTKRWPDGGLLSNEDPHRK